MSYETGLEPSELSEKTYLPEQIEENFVKYPSHLQNTVFRARKQKDQGHYELRIEEEKETYRVTYGFRNSRLGPLNIIEELETEENKVLEEAESLLED